MQHRGAEGIQVVPECPECFQLFWWAHNEAGTWTNILLVFQIWLIMNYDSSSMVLCRSCCKDVASKNWFEQYNIQVRFISAIQLNIQSTSSIHFGLERFWNGALPSKAIHVHIWPGRWCESLRPKRFMSMIICVMMVATCCSSAVKAQEYLDSQVARCHHLHDDPQPVWKIPWSGRSFETPWDWKKRLLTPLVQLLPISLHVASGPASTCV